MSGVCMLQEEVGMLRQRDAERCSLHDRIIAQQADLAAAHSEVQKLSEAVEAANVVIEVGWKTSKVTCLAGLGHAGIIMRVAMGLLVGMVTCCWLG